MYGLLVVSPWSASSMAMAGVEVLASTAMSSPVAAHRPVPSSLCRVYSDFDEEGGRIIRLRGCAWSRPTVFWQQ